MSTVFTIYPSQACHDINFKSKSGRFFTLDILEVSAGIYESEVTVQDPLGPAAGSWVFKTKPASNSADDNFVAGLDLIQKYLSGTRPADSLVDVHNPCNTPFISEADQNRLLSAASIGLKVRVN